MTTPTYELAEFVEKQRTKITEAPIEYSISRFGIRQKVRQIFISRWKEIRGIAGARSCHVARLAKATSAIEVADALRYLAFCLADYANHRQAFSMGRLQNAYRTKYLRFSKRRWAWLKNLVFGMVSGYLASVRNVVLTAVAIWLIFAGLFWATRSGDYGAIIFDNRPSDSVAFSHYLYFSASTLTRMGFAYLVPNVSVKRSARSTIVMVMYLAEGLAGYLLLGLLVFVLMRKLTTHPYGALADWLHEYDRRIRRTVRRPLRRNCRG